MIVVQSPSHIRLFATPWLQHVRLPYPSPSPGVCQVHIQWIGDAIQPSHPLSPPSPLAPNLSQHQGLFQWVSSSNQVAKLLEFQLSISPSNEQSGLISFRIDWFDFLASLESKGLSRVFFSTTIQKHQYFGSQPSLWSSSHIHTYWKNHSFDYTDLCRQSDVSAF